MLGNTIISSAWTLRNAIKNPCFFNLPAPGKPSDDYSSADVSTIRDRERDLEPEPLISASPGLLTYKNSETKMFVVAFSC